MIAKVLAALRSRFASIVSLVLRVDAWVVVVVTVWLVVVDDVTVVTAVVVVVAEVMVVVDGLAPLYVEDFSGETEVCSGVERVMVKAVDSSLGLKK